MVLNEIAAPIVAESSAPQIAASKLTEPSAPQRAASPARARDADAPVPVAPPRVTFTPPITPPKTHDGDGEPL